MDTQQFRAIVRDELAAYFAANAQPHSCEISQPSNPAYQDAVTVKAYGATVADAVNAAQTGFLMAKQTHPRLPNIKTK